MESYYSGVQEDLVIAKPDRQVVISANKFMFLCLMTAGIYPIWWQYKAWRFFKQWQDSDIWPAARAFFSLFNIYQLLKEIERFAHRNELPVKYGTGNMATGYIILSLLARLPDPFWLFSIGAFGFLLGPYKVFVNSLLTSNEVEAVEQRGFNGRQIALLVVFGILWILFILGTVLPEDGN